MFETPEACERAFYAAFEACDLKAMMAVWAEHAPLLCVHPGGSPLTARAAVEESWRRIFLGGARVRITLSDLREVAGEDVCVRYVHENIRHGPDLGTIALVLASNVYVREQGGWRMCSHHASPAPPVVSGGGRGGALH